MILTLLFLFLWYSLSMLHKKKAKCLHNLEIRLQNFWYVIEMKHPRIFLIYNVILHLNLSLISLWPHLIILKICKEPWLELATWIPWAKILTLNIFRHDWKCQFCSRPPWFVRDWATQWEWITIWMKHLWFVWKHICNNNWCFFYFFNLINNPKTKL